MADVGNSAVLAAAAASHEAASASAAVMWGGMAVNGVGLITSNDVLVAASTLVVVVSALWNGYHRRKEYRLRKQVLEAELASIDRAQAQISRLPLADAGADD
jgi:hypothetical protein